MATFCQFCFQFVFVLMGWSILPNVLPRIYVLGREYTVYILLRGLFFQTLGSSTSLKSQTRIPQLKVLPGGLVLRISTP